MDHQIRKHNETVDALIDVCSETKSQFKRILDVLDEYDEAAFKRARSYASVGVVYAESCLQKYKHESSDDAAMVMPPDLPEGVTPSTERNQFTYCDLKKKRPSRIWNSSTTLLKSDSKRIRESFGLTALKMARERLFQDLQEQR
ncbi:hypothetical protein K492DRAFT_193104 [Lichtheimia hyalospora FSU 10163]|nr:hypothetical protein K492DRAFT_193104 [Lichtheimia hyalospora FSU 10163]